MSTELTALPPGIALSTLFAAEFTPSEAREREPQVKHSVSQAASEHDKATVAAVALKKICDEDESMIRFLLQKQGKLTDQLKLKTEQLREEHAALREEFAIEDQVDSLRKLANTLAYYAQELDHWRLVRSGAHLVQYLDAVANETAAEFGELCAIAEYAYVRMVISLESAYVEAGGPVGAISPRVQELRAAATAAGKRWEVAQNAAREQRAQYDRHLAAYVSRGIITSSNVHNAVARY